MEKCERFLQTARNTLDSGDAESGASRAYYALYHMTVLLLSRVKGGTRDRWDQNQLHQAFLDEFCKPGFLFNRNDGNDWGDVMEVRLHADYSIVMIHSISAVPKDQLPGQSV